MQSPAVGVSLCAGIPTDCIETAWGMTWDQDECWGDGSDSGVRIPSLTVCKDAVVTYTVFNCTQPRTIMLNILVDMNEDGDWNDNIRCPDGICAYEWAVRNVTVCPRPQASRASCAPVRPVNTVLTHRTLSMAVRGLPAVIKRFILR